MMSIARAVRCVAHRPQSARAFGVAAGQDAWRHDKKAFAKWCKDATSAGASREKRELYGFLGIAFGDVDANRDGIIDAKEFDVLCEKVAALPRRFGFAPSWEKEYDGDKDKRTKARQAIFDSIDTRNGPARGVIGMKQFVRWANDHIAKKVTTVDLKSRVDFFNIEDYDEKTFLAYLEHALDNPTSSAFATFYQFLLTIFVEADKDCKGQITRDQLDNLLERAARVPRLFGLAPMTASKEERDKVFASMDSNNEGYITFRKFMRWTVEHTTVKVKMHKSGWGYKK